MDRLFTSWTEKNLIGKLNEKNEKLRPGHQKREILRPGHHARLRGLIRRKIETSRQKNTFTFN